MTARLLYLCQTSEKHRALFARQADKRRGISETIYIDRQLRFGPGDWFAWLLSLVGMHSWAGCGCGSRKAQMNRWGWSGCLIRLPYIPFWLAAGLISDWRKPKLPSP